MIDLNEKSKELLQQTGAENSKFFFNYLKPGEYPNYPNGKEDNTHFNEWVQGKWQSWYCMKSKGSNYRLPVMCLQVINR